MPISGYSVTKMLAHTLARPEPVDVTDFRQSRNGDGNVPVAAHSLRECRRAMARRLSLLIFGYPVTKMLARMLARLVDGTDFRLSRNGDGLCPWPRTVCESVGERWSDEAG